MNQYSVLLVDDEEDVLQVIIKKLDWEGMGFRIAGCARNGVEALEMAEELQPDVVMTDIKMPYMDGLTLCRKLKERYGTVKFIVFSGFDEFEYAKEAIKVEVEEYILKPVNSAELREVFSRIRKNLDEELDEKRNIDTLRKYYLESLPLLQESFYALLLEGRIPEHQIKRYVTNYRIDLEGPYYVVTVLHISTASASEGDSPSDPVFLEMSVRKFAEEQLQEKWKSRVIHYLGDVIVLSQFDRVDVLTPFVDELDTICKTAKKVCKARITAGVGYVCSELGQISLSYQGAKQAVSYRVLYGTMKAISISEVDPQESADMPWEENYIQNIIKKIRVGEEEPLKKSVDDFTNRIVKSKISLQRYRILLMEMVAEFVRLGNSHEVNLSLVFGTEDIYNQALQKESTEALREWLLEGSLKLQKVLKNKRQGTTKSFVEKAIGYIREHYSDKDLSVEMVCAYLGMSTAYFSTVFKKETGKTFVKYLTDYRMEQALDLLMNKDEKTYIIAEKVGYSDPNYFSYVFKKQFGMSPLRYKACRTEQS